MLKKSATSIRKTKPTLKKVKTVGDITEYILLSNGLRVLYVNRPGTGVITSNILYKVGSRDETRGETGLAHMLEHMLFRQTKRNIVEGSKPAAIFFGSEIGANVNANTWKDRTTYYFSYPKEHFDRALCIEAERMTELVITDETFKPEQTNVLSEFDSYAGDEKFLIATQMCPTAFHSHPYSHETIGYREDIESFTTEKLMRFYRKYYTPQNAVLIIVGDVSETTMKKSVLAHFSQCPTSVTFAERVEIKEPPQQGMRSVEVVRKSAKQIYALGVRHSGFPTRDWFETMVLFDLLAGGEDSVLYRELVDTGLASELEPMIDPSLDESLGIIFITLTEKIPHEDAHRKVMKIIESLRPNVLSPYIKKSIAKLVMSEHHSRESSSGYVAELVEYVSAGGWETFYESESILKTITGKSLYEKLQGLFDPEKLIIGNFVGKK